MPVPVGSCTQPGTWRRHGPPTPGPATAVHTATATSPHRYRGTIGQVLHLLDRMQQLVALLGELSEVELHSVPVTINRFADGHRTIRR